MNNDMLSNARKAKWRLLKILVGSGATVALVAILVWLPEWLVNRYGKYGGSLSRLEYTRVVDDCRKTVAQLIGGVALIAGLYFTARNLRLAEEGRITDRFSRSVDQLGALTKDGAPLLEVRLGGIHSLRRLAMDSERDSETIIDILGAYVRHNAPRQWPLWDPNSADDPQEPTRRPPPADVQAILSFLGHPESGLHRPVDLSGTELCKANLAGTNLNRASLAGSFLQDANLASSNLRQADLSRSRCVRASFNKADLASANLEDVDAFAASFEGAILSATSFRKANLARATFRNARFALDAIGRCDFTDANLEYADLSGCNLTHVAGLTRQQLTAAVLDKDTKLPNL